MHVARGHHDQSATQTRTLTPAEKQRESGERIGVGGLKKSLADCGGDKRPLLQCWVMGGGGGCRGAKWVAEGGGLEREMVTDLSHC